MVLKLPLVLWPAWLPTRVFSSPIVIALPALVFFAYRGCGGTGEGHVLPACLAVELLHTYLLIHDDIMDRAATRRGGPTAHLVFRDEHRARGWAGSSEHHGESTAILLGDLAASYANELFAAARPDRGPDEALRACWGAMCEEVILGQYLEMTAAYRGELREEDLLRVLQMKSGRYSVQRPIELGALLAAAPEGTRRGLSEFGAGMGEAFQLQDDLLGMFGDLDTTGKSASSDLAEGKYTVLIHHALGAADGAGREAVRAALGNPGVTPSQVERARRALEASGARAHVVAMVEERVARAREALAGLELSDEGRVFFAGLTDYLKEREL